MSPSACSCSAAHRRRHHVTLRHCSLGVGASMLRQWRCSGDPIRDIMRRGQPATGRAVPDSGCGATGWLPSFETPMVRHGGGGLACDCWDVITSFNSRSMAERHRRAALHGVHRPRRSTPPLVRILRRPTSRPGLAGSAPGGWWCRWPTTSRQPCRRGAENGVDFREQGPYVRLSSATRLTTGAVFGRRRCRYRLVQREHVATGGGQHHAPADHALMICCSLGACAVSP